MIRLYWESNNKVLNNSHQSITIRTIDGGFWFCEEQQDGKREVYKIHSRKVIPSKDITMFIETLHRISDDFIQTPCWEHDPQVRSLIRSEGGWSLWQIQKNSQQSLLFLSGSLDSELPQWALQEVGLQYKDIILKSFPKESYKTLDFSNLIHHGQPLQQHLEPQGEFPLQMRQPLSPSSQKRQEFPSHLMTSCQTLNSLKKESQKEPLQQPLQSIAASDSQKVVKVGLLCPPVNLPDAQSPRKLHGRPLRRQQHPLQTPLKDPRVCLIDPSRS
jgi:hypothetical protein